MQNNPNDQKIILPDEQVKSDTGPLEQAIPDRSNARSSEVFTGQGIRDERKLAGDGDEGGNKRFTFPDRKDQATISNNDHFSDVFQGRSSGQTRFRKGAIRKSSFAPVVFRIFEDNNRFSVKFTGRYDQAWIEELHTYGKLTYDKVRKEFLLKWSKLTVDSLADYFASCGVETRVIRAKVSEELKESRKLFGEKIRARDLNDAARDGLDLLKLHLSESRYSPRTCDNYLSALKLFFKYYNERNPSEIDRNDLTSFINDFIIRLGFSSSYQNQMISAIKIYYELSGRSSLAHMHLERPRKTRALPKVFSREEITRILSAPKNIKHRLILWFIYSCGLRRSEVTNIRLSDLDRERSILHIREGKGRVDRIVPIPLKVWAKTDEYIQAYDPVLYLFEGQGGDRYSVESVYNVFKQALRKAKIYKDVGVHSLRHSFATHLHESGLDIRYIQELLGHRSTRTTEIYTHVSRRNLIQVRSPIEDLDI